MGRRDIDDAGIGAGGPHGLLHRVKDRQAQHGLPPFSGGDAAHDLGAVFQHFFGVEESLTARDALDENPGVAIDENTHACTPPFASETARCADLARSGS